MKVYRDFEIWLQANHGKTYNVNINTPTMVKSRTSIKSHHSSLNSPNGSNISSPFPRCNGQSVFHEYSKYFENRSACLEWASFLVTLQTFNELSDDDVTISGSDGRHFMPVTDPLCAARIWLCNFRSSKFHNAIWPCVLPVAIMGWPSAVKEKSLIHYFLHILHIQ